MKRLLRLFITVFMFINFLSCSQSQKGEFQSLPRNFAESKATGSFHDVGDTITFNSELGERRFIRTAGLRFKVRNVEGAVSNIEIKSRALGGFVSFSRLQNSVQDSSAIAISPDSTLQTMQYGKGALLTVRVPNYRLDSLLNYLGILSDVMLNREINSEDVRIRMLTNRLARQRTTRTNQRLTTDIDRKGRKLSEIEQAEKTLEEKNELTDNANISNLILDDAVNFSTVSIEMYQDPVKICKHISKEKTIIGYQRPFMTQISESLSSGWQTVEDIIIAFAQYWSLLFLLIIGYLISFKLFQSGKKIKTAGH